MEVQSLEGTFVFKGKNQPGEKEQVTFRGLRDATFGDEPFRKGGVENS